MAFINENDRSQSYGLIPGDAEPVVYRGWGEHNTQFFNQTKLIDGTLTNTPYSFPQNMYGPQSNISNGSPYMNIGGMEMTILSQPLSTSFNTTIYQDSTANTSFSTTASGNNAITVTPPDAAGTRTDYLVSLNVGGSVFTDGVDARIPSATKADCWKNINTDNGTITADATQSTMSLKALYYGGGATGDTGEFLKVNGDDDTDAITIEWTKNLFTTFSAAGSTITPTGRNSTLTFDGHLGITEEVDGFTIKHKLDTSTAPNDWHSFRTFGFTDHSGSSVQLVADSVGDVATVVVDGPGSSHNQNDTVKKIIEFDVDSDASVDTLTMKLNPLPEAGFGASLVEVTNNDSPVDYLQDQYGGQSIDDITDLPVYVYAIKIHRFSGGNVTSSKDSTATGLLYDFSANQFDASGNLNSSYAGGLSNTSATYTYAPFRVGEVLIAQKIGVNGSGTGVWAIAPTPPKLKVVCP
jgi:hypothetical protein